jgi:hypothetical protein
LRARASDRGGLLRGSESGRKAPEGFGILRHGGKQETDRQCG